MTASVDPCLCRRCAEWHPPVRRARRSHDGTVQWLSREKWNYRSKWTNVEKSSFPDTTNLSSIDQISPMTVRTATRARYEYVQTRGRLCKYGMRAYVYGSRCNKNSDYMCVNCGQNFGLRLSWPIPDITTCGGNNYLNTHRSPRTVAITYSVCVPVAVTRAIRFCIRNYCTDVCTMYAVPATTRRRLLIKDTKNSAGGAKVF